MGKHMQNNDTEESLGMIVFGALGTNLTAIKKQTHNPVLVFPPYNLVSLQTHALSKSKDKNGIFI